MSPFNGYLLCIYLYIFLCVVVMMRFFKKSCEHFIQNSPNTFRLDKMYMIDKLVPFVHLSNYVASTSI